MPENTDTNRTVSEVDVSGFEALQGVQAPEIPTPDIDPEDHRLQFVEIAKSLMPEHAYTSNRWLANELRENGELRSTLTENIIQHNLQSDEQFSRKWNSDEDDSEEWRQNFRKGLETQVFEGVTRAVIRGKTAKENIVSHHLERTYDEPEYDVTNPISVVASSPDEFQDWFDPKEVKNNQVSEDIVRSRYEGDAEFREKIIRVNLQNFENQLGNKANQGVFDPTRGPQEASEYAKAYAIYNRFGSEALTDYVNILQHYIPNDPSQDSRVTNALHRFRRSPQYKGVDVFQYAGNFVKGQKGLRVEPNDPIAPFNDTIQKYANEFDVDPTLLAGIITQESILAAVNTNSNPVDIESSVGAVGLMQLMPDTAQELGLIVNDEQDERTNPEKNIMAGTKYLSQLIKRFEGDETKALAAYNAGMGTVDKAIARAEEEGGDWQEYMREFQSESNFEQTANYIPKVQEYRKRYNEFAKTTNGLQFDTRRPIEKKPRDWNAITETLVYTPDNETEQTSRGRANNFIKGVLTRTIGEDFDWKQQMGMEDPNKPFEPKNLFSELQQVYAGDDVEIPSYDGFVYDLVESAANPENEEYGFEDIIRTLAANATNVEMNDSGEAEYILDYGELMRPENFHLRAMVDGLNIHGLGDQIMTKSGNRVVIEPNKQARRDRQMAQRWIFDKEPRPIWGEESRSLVGWEQHVPNNFTNAVAGTLTGLTNILPEAYGGVVGGWFGNFAEWMGANEDVMEFFDNQRHKSRDFYSGTLADFTDPVWQPYGMPFSLTDIGVAGGTLAGYLLGINALGKMAFKAPGLISKVTKGGGFGSTSLFSSVSAMRKARNFREMYKLAPLSTSRAAMTFRNTANAVGKNLTYATWPKFVVGSAAVETITDPEYSLAGLVTQGMAAAGVETEWNPDRTYRTAGHMGRWAMDFVAGEMLGLVFDGMIGVTKLANDHTVRALRGKPKIGLEFDPKTGRYLPESDSAYNTWGGARKYIFPEIQRFAYNVRNGVNAIPVGDIRESAMRYMRYRGVGPENYGEEVTTQADIAAKIVSEGNDFMATMKDDLRYIINDASEKFGGTARLSSDQVTEQVDEIYDELMDQMAKQIYSLVGKDQAWNVDTLARQLEEHPGDLWDRTPLEFDGRQTVTRAEAQILKNRHKGSHVVPVSEGQYKVYQQDPALWRFDLAKRLRQYGTTVDSFDANINRHMSRFGLQYGEAADEEDIIRVIDTLEQTQGVGIRSGNKEGVVSGFSSKGWEVRWDDGTDEVFGTIKGVDGLPERPPEINVRESGAPTDTGRTATAYDEAGRAIEEEEFDVTGKGTSGREVQPSEKTLDARPLSERIDEELGIARQGNSEEARAERQQQLAELFPDADTEVQRLKGELKTAMNEGRHDDADDIVRRISELRQGDQPVSGEAIALPGIVRLQEIVDQDRAAYAAYRAAQEPDDPQMQQLQNFHRERLIDGLRTRNDEDVVKDIKTLRAMGVDEEEIDALIKDNAIGDQSLADYYRNVNRSQSFGESVTDDLIAARVDSKRIGLIEDEAFNSLPKRVQEQLIEQADMLAAARGKDTPQTLIDNGDPEVTAARSWETSNERFRENRTRDDGVSPREYALQVASDLGVSTLRDVAKLQKTRAGGSTKIPIRTMSHEDLIGPDGRITPIKNSKGLVVRVEPFDGGLPYYAIGKKNNIKGFPTRFVTDQNGQIITNQEWAFINPNVTQRADGKLKRFNPYTLENGDVVYREHAYGKLVLNIQNPVRVKKSDLTGSTLKGTDGKNQVIPGQRVDEILTPDAVFKRQVDAIEIIEPGSSRKMYRPVSPESQVFKHGKPATDPGDQRVPNVTFETADEPLNAGEVLSRLSKEEGANVYSHAWLAIPGMIATGGIGIDENGELTTVAKVGLAIGAIGIGGILMKSMRGNFKLRGAYDKLDPKFKQTFDKFDWRKIDENGKPILDQLTDDESAMFNRLQGVPKDDYKMLRELTGTGIPKKGGDYMTVTSVHGGLIRGENIPEISAEMRAYRDERYTKWATDVNEDGQIIPKSSRKSKDVQVIGLEFDEVSTELNTRIVLGHTFSEPDGTVNRPIAWARFQKGSDGRLLLDELQVDNALQKGTYGITGDVNRDLYSVVLDEIVERAIRDSDGEFYVTRGDMQASRYGPPKSVRDRLRTLKPKINDEAQQRTGEFGTMEIGDFDTIRNRLPEPPDWMRSSRFADDIDEGLRKLYAEQPLIKDIVDQFSGVVTRNNGVFALWDMRYRPALNILGDLYRADNANRTFLDIESVSSGNTQIKLRSDAVESDIYSRLYMEDPLLQKHFVTSVELMSYSKHGTGRGTEDFYDNTLPNVIKKRYGAEVADAMGPPKDAYDSPREAFHLVKVTQEGLDNARNKTGKRINWELIPGSLALTGLGYAAYNMEDIGAQPDNSPEAQQAGLGALSMVLLGTVAVGMFGRGRLRTKIAGNIKGKIRNMPKNVVDKTNAKALEIDGIKASNRELFELNAHINPHDPESISRQSKLLRGINMTMSAGRNVGEWFANSPYTQAGIQHLRKISETIKIATGTRGRVVADDIMNYLQGAHNAPARLTAKVDTHFNTTLGYGEGAFRNFANTKGVQAVNNVLSEATDEKTARVMFGDAVTRLMNRGATKNDGRPIVKTDTPPHVRQQYEGERGEFLQRLDEALLRDPEVMDYIDALHFGYREVRKEYLGLLAGELGRRLVRFKNRPDVPGKAYKIGDTQFTHDDLMRMMENWVTDKNMLTYREFLKTLNPDERQLMRAVKANSNVMFDDIYEIQNMRRRFTDLEGRYVPQMVDFDKAHAARQRYVDEATNNPQLMEEVDVRNPENYAQRKMQEDFKALNATGDGRGLLGFDPETLSVRTQTFDTVDEARLKLLSIINEGATDKVRAEWDTFFGDRQLTNQLMEDLGFVRRTTGSDGKPAFELRQPEGLEISENIFETANNMKFNDYYNKIMLDPAVRKSNFLENPRDYHLPMSWMVTDPDQIWKRYAWDTGTRLHSLRHGIFKGRDFERNFTDPLQRAMRNAGYDPEQADKSVTRIREMYNTQFGIIRELSELSEAEATTKMNSIRKANSAFNTYRNLDYAKRTYGFKYLSWFETLVSSLTMTSSKAVKSALGFGPDALSQGGLKQLEGLFKDLHIIKEKDMSFRFDIQPNDPTGQHGSALTWAHKNSQRLADNVSDFSLEKSFLKLLGVDVGSTGRATRLLTSSFHDVNVMNTAMNGWAFMAKGQDLARIGRQMQLQGIAPDDVYRAADGSQYGWNEIYRQLEDVGISRHNEFTVKNKDGTIRRTNEADYFIEKEGELSAWMDRVKNNNRVSINDFDGRHADIVEKMWHHATESYHGTNRVMRPEKWNTPLGRTMSMYASFTFNVAMQNVRRRMLDPVDNWIGRYAMDAEGNQQVGRLQLPRLLKMVRQGDEDGLRAVGIADPKRAIADFPIEAINTMQRGVVSMGFGIATYTTMDVIRDIYAYPVQAALGVPDEERFGRTRALLRDGIINPYAPANQQVTMSELFGGEADAQDMASIIAWGVGKVGQSSYGGMYMSPFESIGRYGYRGLTSLTPALGIADRFSADIFSFVKPFATLDFENTMPETGKFMIQNLPIVGSNVFTETRNSVKNSINEYQKTLEEEETSFTIE